MPHPAKAEFVKGTRSCSIVELVRRGPVGPPTWAEMSGVRDRDPIPGRPHFSSTRRTVRPGQDATRPEIAAFLMEFLELGPARIPQSALEPRVRQLCTMLGWRKFVGKARFIACDIAPMKQRGAPNVEERKRIDAWLLAMKKKCRDLQDELKTDI